MKRLITVATVSFALLAPVVCAPLFAQDAPAAKPKVERERPAPTEMTVTGKVTKEERAGRDGKTYSMFAVTDAAGNKVMLPGPDSRMGRHEAKPGAEVAAPAVKLEEYINKDVKIAGKGVSYEREGKKMTRIVSITTIEVVAPAVVAPAAPAAAVPVVPAAQ